MRTWIIGAAALLAVAAAPSVASAQASGYVGVTYSNIDVNHGGSENAWGAEGSVAFSGSSQISFEVDGSIIDPDHSDSIGGLTGHVFTRNDSYLFGGFVGFANGDGNTAWWGGLEANKFFDRWTLAGAVEYANDDDANVNGWGVNAQARFFPTDNLRLQAEAGWARISFPGNDEDAWTAGVGAEYQFSSVPVSIGAGYNHVEINDSDASANIWSVSLRYNFGGGTLFDRDRHGASQSDLVNLTNLIGGF